MKTTLKRSTPKKRALPLDQSFLLNPLQLVAETILTPSLKDRLLEFKDGWCYGLGKAVALTLASKEKESKSFYEKFDNLTDKLESIYHYGNFLSVTGKAPFPLPILLKRLIFEIAANQVSQYRQYNCVIILDDINRILLASEQNPGVIFLLHEDSGKLKVFFFDGDKLFSDYVSDVNKFEILLFMQGKDVIFNSDKSFKRVTALCTLSYKISKYIGIGVFKPDAFGKICQKLLISPGSCIHISIVSIESSRGHGLFISKTPHGYALIDANLPTLLVETDNIQEINNFVAINLIELCLSGKVFHKIDWIIPNSKEIELKQMDMDELYLQKTEISPTTGEIIVKKFEGDNQLTLKEEEMLKMKRHYEPYFKPNQKDYRGQDLSNFSFVNLLLSNVTFSGAVLYGTNFSGANLAGCNFKGALIDEKTNFSNANLEGAKFDTLPSRYIWKNLTRATLSIDPKKDALLKTVCHYLGDEICGGYTCRFLGKSIGQKRAEYLFYSLMKTGEIPPYVLEFLSTGRIVGLHPQTSRSVTLKYLLRQCQDTQKIQVHSSLF